MSPDQDQKTVWDRNADDVDVSDESPIEEPGQFTPGLVIPETRDGFFGYNEEKSLQHVSSSNTGANSTTSFCPPCHRLRRSIGLTDVVPKQLNRFRSLVPLPQMHALRPLHQSVEVLFYLLFTRMCNHSMPQHLSMLHLSKRTS
jgi:hypothetical protein